MIDNPKQVDCLLADLRASLPIPATMSRELRAKLHDLSPGEGATIKCRVMQVDYAGDDGGIMCKLELDGELADHALFVSITHLGFGGSPLARDIAAYQKHRLKKIIAQFR